MSDLKIQGVVEMSSEGAERAFDRVGQKADSMSQKVAQGSEQAGRAVDKIGSSAERNAEGFTRSESRIVSSIKRSTTALQELGKTASQKLELKIEAKGLDRAKFEPYLKQLREVEAAQKSVAASAGKVPAAFDAIAASLGALGAAFAGFSAKGLLSDIISETEQVERNLLRTEALLRATGNAAGFSARQLRDQARELALGTLQSVEGVERAQQVLLSYSSVQGDVFTRAIELSADLSTLMGTNLVGATETLAKALDAPAERLSSLTRIGFNFTKQQEDQIKALVETNRTLEAQQIILDTVAGSFGGLARAEAMGFAGAQDTLAQRVQEAKVALGEYYRVNETGARIVNSVAAQVDAFAESVRGGNDALTALASVDLGVMQTALETVVVLGGNVAYTFRAIGTELGGIAAQAAAVAQLDFAGAREIGRLMRDDAEAARAEIDRWSEGILSARGNAAALRETMDAARKGTADYNATVGKLIELQSAGKITAQQFRQAVESLQPATQGIARQAGAITSALAGTQKAVKQTRDEIAALLDKLAAKEIEEAARAVEAYNKAWRDYLGGLDSTARKLDEQIEQYGLTSAQIAQVTLRRAEERLEMAKANGGVTAQYLAGLEREVELRRKIAASAGTLEAMQANEAAARQAAEDWQRTADNIEKALIDALMEGGKSGKEYIEGLFRTMVLRPIVQAIVQPIAGSLTNAMGFGAPGQGSSGGSFGLPPGLGTTGLISSGIQWAGAALGSSAIGSFGAGMAMTSSQIAGLSGAGLISGGAATAGATVAAAMPYIGAALFAAQALGLFDKKPSDKSSWASFDPATGRTFDVGSMTGKKDPGQEQRDATASLVQGAGAFAVLAGIESVVRATVGGRDGIRLAVEDGWKTPTGSVDKFGSVAFGGDMNAAFAAMLDDLIDEGTLPQATIDRWKAAKSNADGTAREAAELVDTLALINQGLSDTEILRADLIQAEGETLGQAATRIKDMMAAFEPITADEAWTKATRALADEFGKLGQAMPQTAQQFSSLMNSLDLTTDAGQDAYRAMTSLAPAFLQLSSVVDEVFASISKTTAESVRDIEMAVLDNAGKYAYLDTEINSLIEKLGQSVDPATIQGLFEQINTKTTQAFNLLDEAEQKRLATDFIDRLYEAESLAQNRLSVTPIDYQPQQDAAVAQQQAAQQQAQAAADLAKAASDLAAAVAQMGSSTQAGAGSLVGAASALQSAAGALASASRATSEVGY